MEIFSIGNLQARSNMFEIMLVISKLINGLTNARKAFTIVSAANLINVYESYLKGLENRSNIFYSNVMNNKIVKKKSLFILMNNI